MEKEIDSRKFGLRIAERRKDLGLSQKALGKRTGHNQRSISNAEGGNLENPERQAHNFAAALSTTPEWLLYGRGPRHVGPRYPTDAQILHLWRALTPEQKEEWANTLPTTAKVPATKNNLAR